MSGDSVSNTFKNLDPGSTFLGQTLNYNLNPADAVNMYHGTDTTVGGNSANILSKDVHRAIAGPPAGPDQPTPAGPDFGKIRQSGIYNQIQDEQIARAQRTLFTGGSGLLDQPTTASRVLLGS